MSEAPAATPPRDVTPPPALSTEAKANKGWQIVTSFFALITWDKINIVLRSATSLLALIAFIILTVYNGKGGANQVNAVKLTFTCFAFVVDLVIVIPYAFLQAKQGRRAHVFLTYTKPFLDAIIVGTLILSDYSFLDFDPCAESVSRRWCAVASPEFMRGRPDPYYEEATWIWWVNGRSQMVKDMFHVTLAITIMHAIYIGTGIYDWVVMLRARRAGKGMADEEAAEVKTIEEKPSAPPPEVGEALPIPARTPTPPQISETEEGATPKAPSRTLEAGDGVKTNSPSEPLDAKGKERARYEID